MSADTVRTIVVVTIVSLLVWLFAESRTLRVQSITVPVEISVGGTTTAFRLLDGENWTGEVDLELAGPAGLVDGIRAKALEGVTLEIGDELPADPGTRTVELIDAMRRVELFAESGASVRRVSPPTIQLQTDRLESMALPVEVDLEGLETSGRVTVEPPEVVVRLPASIAEGLELHAAAKIPPSKLSGLTPGRRNDISQIPIELRGLPEDTWGMRLVDPRVVVTLALRVRTASLTLREMPVRLSVAPADLAVWAIEVPPEDRVLEDFEISAPVSVIDQIESGEVSPGALAVLDLGGIDETVTEAERVVPVRLVGLPTGVVADFGERLVRVQIRRRSAAESAEELGG